MRRLLRPYGLHAHWGRTRDRREWLLCYGLRANAHFQATRGTATVTAARIAVVTLLVFIGHAVAARGTQTHRAAAVRERVGVLRPVVTLLTLGAHSVATALKYREHGL
jgi:hypothetical protein